MTRLVQRDVKISKTVLNQNEKIHKSQGTDALQFYHKLPGTLFSLLLKVSLYWLHHENLDTSNSLESRFIRLCGAFLCSACLRRALLRVVAPLIHNHSGIQLVNQAWKNKSHKWFVCKCWPLGNKALSAFHMLWFHWYP